MRSSYDNRAVSLIHQVSEFARGPDIPYHFYRIILDIGIATD